MGLTANSETSPSLDYEGPFFAGHIETATLKRQDKKRPYYGFALKQQTLHIQY